MYGIPIIVIDLKSTLRAKLFQNFISCLKTMYTLIKWHLMKLADKDPRCFSSPQTIYNEIAPQGNQIFIQFEQTIK